MIWWRVSAGSERSSAYRFGIFEVDAGACELRRHGARMKLQAKPFGVQGGILGLACQEN